MVQVHRLLICLGLAGGLKVPLQRFEETAAPPTRQLSSAVFNVSTSSMIPFSREAALAAFAAASTTSMTTVGAVYYIGPITIGSQTFQTIYDTGSNLIWVPASSCATCGDNHSKYTSSPNSGESNKFSINYFSGSVSGIVATTSVSLAGASLSSFQVGLVDSVGIPNYSRAAFDGVCGLAWSSLSDGEIPSLVPALFAAGQISANLFTIFLDPNGGNGELNIGNIDSSKYTGEIAYLPLVAETWWKIRLNGFAVKSDDGNVSSLSYYSAIVDSGSSLIVGPIEEITQIIAAIEESGTSVFIAQESSSFYVPCTSSLPELNITISGSDRQAYHFYMPGTALLMRPTFGSLVCQLALQGHTINSDYPDWILGVPFMRSFYTVFDYSQSRVGLAVPSGAEVVSKIEKGNVVPSGAASFSFLSFILSVSLVGLLV
jgi:hypothetical protein